MSGTPPELGSVVAAHRTLDRLIAGLTDAQARQPSLLPDWTIGHVLTHLARNADGFAGMFEGAARGEVVDQYPGGAPSRTASIEAGAGRPAAELVVDVHDSSARLEAAWNASDWAGRGRTMSGEIELPEIVVRRWREVVVHTVDLGMGYGWDDVPGDYIRAELSRMAMLYAARRPMGLTELPAEALAATPRRRLAWLLGRVEIPGLDPAGIY